MNHKYLNDRVVSSEAESRGLDISFFPRPYL